MLTQNLQSGHGPCPVTGKKQNWSYKGPSHNPTFVIVYGNVESYASEWTFVGESSNGAQMFTRREQGGPEDKKHLDFLEKHEAEKAPECRPLAEIKTRDLVYQTLFELCTLNSEHKAHLRGRRLSHKKIKHLLSCGSMPPPAKRPKIAQKVMERCGLDLEDILQVPGFFINKRGHLSFKGAEGIMLPTRDVNGMIQAIQVRSMKGAQGKYLWMSSAREGGPGSGAPASFFGDPKCDHVWITEGSFKAVSLLLHGYAKAVISIAGVGNISSAIEQLKALPNVKGAMIAYDSDCLSNSNVMSSLAKLLDAVEDEGLQVATLCWDKAWGKGIDDALKRGITVEHFVEMPRDGIKRWARKTRNFMKIKKSRQPTWQPLSGGKQTLKELRDETFRMIGEAVRRGPGSFNLIENTTGSGKTYSTAFQARRGTLFVCNGYKPLYELQDELIERHGEENVGVLLGRTSPYTENSKEYKHKERYQIAGCPYFSEMRQRSAKGHSPCEGCPLKPQHAKKQEGEEEQRKCPYWRHRLQSREESRPFLLCVKQTFVSNPDIIDMLPEHPNLDLMGRQYPHLNIDDTPEFPELLANVKEITAEDIEEWRMHPGIMKDDPEHQLAKKWADKLALFFCRGELNKAYGLNGKNETKALTSLRELSKHIVSQEEIICEQPYYATLPMKLMRRIAASLVKGGSLYFSKRKDNKKVMSFLSPPDELLARIPNTTLNFLDATADRALLLWFASLLGMSFNAPETTKLLPRIIQVFDKLWDKSQVKKYQDMFEKLLSAIKEKDNNSVTFTFKVFEEELRADGHWGCDERGLNCFQGAAWMLLVGHYALPEEEMLKQAWKLRALAHHIGGVSPDEYIKEETFDTMRKYHDDWRPWEREMYVSKDPLAEHLRRHHATSIVVQAGGRARNQNVNVLLFSGEPLDGLAWDVPVELVTTKELLDEFGITFTPTPDPDDDGGGHDDGGDEKQEEEKQEEHNEEVQSKQEEQGPSEVVLEEECEELLSGCQSTRSDDEIILRDHIKQDHSMQDHFVRSLPGYAFSEDRLIDEEIMRADAFGSNEIETELEERVRVMECQLSLEELAETPIGIEGEGEGHQEERAGMQLGSSKMHLGERWPGEKRSMKGAVDVFKMRSGKIEEEQGFRCDVEQIESPQKGVSLIDLKRALSEQSDSIPKSQEVFPATEIPLLVKQDIHKPSENLGKEISSDERKRSSVVSLGLDLVRRDLKIGKLLDKNLGSLE